MEHFIELDKALFLFLNGLHTPWLDSAMRWATKPLFWTPLYLFLLYRMILDKKWDTLYILCGIVLAVALADQITSGLMKPFFARPRPSHDMELKDIVHIVAEYRGGLYGFASGHAANSFSISLLLYGLFRKNRPIMVGFVFLCALISSYTRIYLGVHYPADIFAGWIVGLLCAGFVLLLMQRLRPSVFKCWVPD